MNKNMDHKAENNQTPIENEQSLDVSEQSSPVLDEPNEFEAVKNYCDLAENPATELANLQHSINELRNAVMLEKAENENLRKRHKREIDNATQYGLTKFAQDLVEVLENLHRARSHVKIDTITDVTTQNMIDGIEMTIKSFESVLAKYSIKRLFPLNEEFDHRYHQAIAQIENSTVAENTVLDVIQAGYIIHDRLLKPAMVAVAKKSSNT